MDFKYGDRVEVRDTDSGKWSAAFFVAMDHNSGGYPYVCRKSGHPAAIGVRHCRRARQDLKPGQPVVVWDESCSSKYLRWFDFWEDGKVVCKSGQSWDNYALLKNYAYSAPVEEF